MMTGDGLLTNALWWAHFQLQGGPRRVAWRTAVYAAVLVLTFLVVCRFARPMPVSAIANRSLYIVGIVQLIMLIAVASGRIYKAVMHDNQVHMIESHRLSPMTGGAAVIGFLFGPNLQVLCYAGVNLVAGVILAVLEGSLVSAWLIAHVYLAFVALFIWSAALLGVLCLGKGANLLTVIFVFLFVGGWRLLDFIPGLGLLCGAEMIGYCYGLVTGGGPSAIPAGAVFSGVVQIVVVYVWLRAAARKFERPDLPAFPVLWAAAFFVGWLFVAGIGLQRASALSLPFAEFEVPRHWQFVATLTISMLLMVLPIRSAAVIAQRWRQQHRALAGRRPLGPLLVASVLSLLTAGALLAAYVGAEPSTATGHAALARRPTVGQSVWSITSLTLNGLALAALYRAACARRLRRIDTAAIVYVLLLWAALPVIDAGIAAYTTSDSFYAPEPTALTACSMVGGLFLAWGEEPQVHWIGLASQGVVCAVAIGLEVAAIRWSDARRRAKE